MSRAEYSPEPPLFYFSRSPRVLAVSLLALLASGCSGDVSRFDEPMFGLTESGRRVSSAPIPQESVYGARMAALPESTGAGYAAAPQDREQAGMSPTYAPMPASGAPYQASPQPSYQPPYRPSDQASYQPGNRPDYQPPYPPQAVPYRTAAVPPPTGAVEPYRPGPQLAAPPSAREPARGPSAPSSTAGAERSIEVQPGDTLYGLSQQHRVSISEFMRVNGLTSPAIHPGQRLRLPGAASSRAVAARRGPEAASDGARVAALAPPPAADPRPSLPTRDAAPVAQLPTPQPSRQAAEAAGENAEEGTVTLHHGESLYGIAVRHKVPLAELQRVNNIADPRKVKSGTVLKLPSRAGAPGTAVASLPPPVPAPAKSSEPASGLVPSVAKPTIINAQPTQVAALTVPGSASDTGGTQLPGARAEPAAPMPPVGAKTAASSPADAQETLAAKFRWPVRGKIISGFGARPDGSQSDGIKLAVPLGTEVHAAESGVVAYAGNELKGYGNLVLLRHDNGWITAYAHNDELSVTSGDRVRRGQVIAKAGKTGNADQPQLHFELRQGSSPVDPIPYLEKL